MDNYKIKVKDEQNFKEVVSLINTLGYGINFSYSNASGEVVKGLFLKRNGLVEWTHRDTYFDFNDSKELTLPQLRDLVVLNRNDVKDATHQDKYDASLKYVYLNGEWYEWINGWMSGCINPAKLTPITQPQDPALISGADALRALIDGHEVQGRLENQVQWTDINPKSDDTLVKSFLTEKNRIGIRCYFRFKPQTIKLELELPKPFEPEEDCHVYILDDGKTDGYRRYSYEVHGDKGNTFIGIWRTKEEIKQVVEQLRKIRGTNS
ncbi:hypothetical protein NQ853_01760 [Acinetobacter baumannii]|nr:hypothetical protein [Acinetobacter baumannii]